MQPRRPHKRLRTQRQSSALAYCAARNDGEVEAYRRSLQDRGIVFRPPSPGHHPVDNDYLTSAIVRVQRGQQLVATRLQIYNDCSRLRDLHRELETFEPRLGWAFVAEEEKKRDALPNRRWQRKREIQEVIDASIQAVEEEYGPRMELAPDETVASLKARAGAPRRAYPGSGASPRNRTRTAELHPYARPCRDQRCWA